MEERIEKFSNSQTRRESIYNIYKKWKLNEAYDTVTKKMLDKKNSPKNLSTNLKETNLLDSQKKKKKRKQIYYKIMEDYNIFNAKYILNWIIIKYSRSIINAYSLFSHSCGSH